MCIRDRDFEQLAQIIDRIGGVTVNCDEDEARYLAGYPNVHVGDCLLDGKTAVSYARIRKSSATDSDRKRTGRQREVILSILNTLQTMPLSQYPGFVRDCLGMCATSFEAETLLTLSLIHISSSGCSGERTMYVAPNSVSGRVVNTVISSPNVEPKRTSAPVERPIQLRC